MITLAVIVVVPFALHFMSVSRDKLLPGEKLDPYEGVPDSEPGEGAYPPDLIDIDNSVDD